MFSNLYLYAGQLEKTSVVVQHAIQLINRLGVAHEQQSTVVRF